MRFNSTRTVLAVNLANAIGISSAVAVFLASVASAGVVTAVWTSPSSGSWSDGSNWSSGVPPINGGGSFFNAVIDGNAKIGVGATITGPTQINGLTITAGDAVYINPAVYLGVAGPVTNNGQLVMYSSGYATDFFFTADLALNGSGSLLGTNVADRVYAASGDLRLTNGAAHLIHGALALGLNQTQLTNLGTIDSDLSSMTVDAQDNSTLRNSGTLRASSGATLILTPGTVDNTGGLIEAAAGSVVALNGGSITGGTLRDTDGTGPGYIHSTNGLLLSDVTIQGGFNVDQATALRVSGAIDFQAPLYINSYGYATDLILASTPFALAGSDPTVNFTDNPANRLYGEVGSHRLVVAPNGYIHGGLQLGINSLALTNNGLIQADGVAGITLDLDDGSDNYNTGTIRAVNGSTINTGGFTLHNEGGVIEAGNGSSVRLSNVTIIGGTIRDQDGPGPGVVRNPNQLWLQDLAIQGELNADPATATHLRGAIDFQGPLNVTSNGYSTDVVLETSPFTLEGSSATINFSNETANRMYSVAGDLRLVLAPNAVIRGSFQLGINQMRLTNDGLIDADSPSGAYLDLVDDGPNYNTGVIRASNGAALRINQATIDNTGGVIEAGADSIVYVGGTTLVGGIVRDADGAGPGAVHNNSSATLRDVTVQGEFHTDTACALRLEGAVDFQGPLLVDSTGFTTDVIINQEAPFSLSGTGDTVFSNTLANRLYGMFGYTHLTIAPGHTLRGSVQLGINQLKLTNAGTIRAEGNQGIYIDVDDSSTFINQGTLHAQGGDLTIYPGGFATEGTVQIDAGRTLTRYGSYLQLAGGTNVQGTLYSTGEIQILSGTLSGSGQVNGHVTNFGGTVSPGNSAGTLAFNQGFAQSGGTVAIEIGGAAPGSQHDVLAVTGDATLSGSLNVTRINGFSPSPGQTFTILTCTGSLTGVFGHIEGCDKIDVIYGDHSVSVQFFGSFDVVGDLTNDGQVDGADLGALLALWGPCNGPCCVADLNGDGFVDGADLGTLLGNWS